MPPPVVAAMPNFKYPGRAFVLVITFEEEIWYAVELVVGAAGVALVSVLPFTNVSLKNTVAREDNGAARKSNANETRVMNDFFI